MNGLILRPARMEDADMLLDWRNDPETRRASHDTGALSKDEHVVWLTRALADESRQLYIAEENGRPVGTVRVDRDVEGCELSWAVAPQARGHGVAKRMVATLAGQIREPLRAEIRIDNVASVRVAEHAGMQLQHERDGVLHYARPAAVEPSSEDQAAFWCGEFGDAYTDRNRGAEWVAANSAFFAHVLRRAPGLTSVLELGSNIGLNLAALRQLLPHARLSAVEINTKAAGELKASMPDVDLHVGSITEFQPGGTWDIVFTKGVLIHLNPDALPDVYDLMYRASARYVLVAEYYNPSPTEISYRGHAGNLFKRDFAGEMLDRFPDLSLVDYGFVYHRDPTFPQDDITWFLMQKV